MEIDDWHDLVNIHGNSHCAISGTGGEADAADDCGGGGCGGDECCGRVYVPRMTIRNVFFFCGWSFLGFAALLLETGRLISYVAVFVLSFSCSHYRIYGSRRFKEEPSTVSKFVRYAFVADAASPCGCDQCVRTLLKPCLRDRKSWMLQNVNLSTLLT